MTDAEKRKRDFANKRYAKSIRGTQKLANTTSGGPVKSYIDPTQKKGQSMDTLRHKAGDKGEYKTPGAGKGHKVTVERNLQTQAEADAKADYEKSKTKSKPKSKPKPVAKKPTPKPVPKMSAKAKRVSAAAQARHEAARKQDTGKSTVSKGPSRSQSTRQTGPKGVTKPKTDYRTSKGNSGLKGKAKSVLNKHINSAPVNTRKGKGKAGKGRGGLGTAVGMAIGDHFGGKIGKHLGTKLRPYVKKADKWINNKINKKKKK